MQVAVLKPGAGGGTASLWRGGRNGQKRARAIFHILMHSGVVAANAVALSAQQVNPDVLPQAACLDGGGPSRELVARANGRELRTAECLIYPYGTGKPRLVCAMNRSCHIILQDGEELRDKSLPDPRWTVEQMRGPNNTLAVAVKPRFCDITSNLFFSTNRRFYSILLDSAPCAGADVDSTRFNPRLPYTDVLIFYYPDGAGISAFGQIPRAGVADTLASSVSAAPRQNELGSQTDEAPAPGYASDRESRPLHLSYDVRHDRGFPWVPRQVYDNGESTFIYYPERARQFAFPIVYEVADDGKLVAVPYRNAPEQGFIRVDRVVRRLALVISQPGRSITRLVLERKAGQR